MSCPECFKGGIHSHATPRGNMQTLYGVSSYVASPRSESTSKSQILFLCDAFGLNLVNNKLLADRYATETGCRVVVPELIPGGAAPVKALDIMDSILAPVALTDIVGQLWRAWSVVHAIFLFTPFMIRAAPAGAYPPILKFARNLKEDMQAGGKLGVCGFCWGGYGSTRLCTETTEEGGSIRLIDAQYNAHPSKLKTPDMILDAITKFNVPYSVAIGDNDMAMGINEVLATEAALKEKVGEPKANNYEIKIYKGCRHGFATRAQIDNKIEIQAAEDAASQAINWFNKYLN